MNEPNAELNEPGLSRALAELNSVLIPGESVEAWARRGGHSYIVDVNRCSGAIVGVNRV